MLTCFLGVIYDGSSYLQSYSQQTHHMESLTHQQHHQQQGAPMQPSDEDWLALLQEQECLDVRGSSAIAPSCLQYGDAQACPTLLSAPFPSFTFFTGSATNVGGCTAAKTMPALPAPPTVNSKVQSHPLQQQAARMMDVQSSMGLPQCPHHTNPGNLAHGSQLPPLPPQQQTSLLAGTLTASATEQSKQPVNWRGITAVKQGWQVRTTFARQRFVIGT